MATELLQELEGLSMSAHLDQGFLQTDISNFEEVEEIVKSNLRMISHMTHDENAQDGFPEHQDEYTDLLGMLNMPSSDLEEKDAAGSNVNEKSVNKDEGHNESCFNFEKSVESPEMPQSSKDLLDDITFVINSDKNFTHDCHLVSSNIEGVEGDRKEMLRSDQSVGKLDVSSRLLSKESIKTVATKIPLREECLVEYLDNPSRDHQQKNLHQVRNVPAKDVYFEQSLHDLLDGASSEVLTPPQEQNLSQENLFNALKSLDSLSESSLVERSCTMFPSQSFRDANTTVKESAQNRLAPELDDDQDVTVDGEGEDNVDGGSLDLCPLSFDENLTCSFYERLQLHNDDNSELTEHGPRGRPSRQKVTRQAVPCKIEPKVSQPSLQPGFLPPQLFSSAFQNCQPGLASVMPSMPQPCFGQELVRFPVLLHRKTDSCGQLYLEVCPDITQLTTSSQTPVLSSAPQPDNRSCSPNCNSENVGSSSNVEVAPEKTNFGPSLDTSSHMLGDISKVSQNQFSLEIDGPIRRQVALSQGRYGSSRNDPYFRVAMGNSAHASGSAGPTMGSTGQFIGTAGHAMGSTGHAMGNSGQAMGNSGQAMGGLGYALGSSGHAVGNSGLAFGSPIKEPYRIPTVQGNHNFTVNSHNIAPTSFVSSSPSLIRVQDASGFGGNVQNCMPYISTGMEETLYQNNQNVPASNTSINYGTHDQLSQFLLSKNNNQYSNSASSTNTHSHHFGQGNSGEPMGNWMSEPNINIVASSVSQGDNNNLPRHAIPSDAIPYARISSPGLPNIPVDPLSRRVRMLMAMGSQRQVNIDSSSSAVYSATTPQNAGRFPASNNEYDDNMIQLSPPAELRNPQLVSQQNTNPPGPAHVPSSGATADGSAMDKSAFHPKSAPSHSSTRSSKGPELPVPTERSKTRVEQWLINNVMFRPDLDSGTFDPSDYSLVHANMSHQYPEAAGSEGASSEQSYEYVGLFAGKRMTVVPPQASAKQKPNKRTIGVHHHGKGSPLTQAGQNRQSIISDASVITESSLSSGHTNSSKGKHTEGKQEASNVYQNKPPGRKPVARNTETPTSAFAASNQEIPKTRQEELPMSSQSLSSHPLDQLDENQQADLAIAEDMKFLEQTSFEKRLAGMSSPTSSGHVLSELEQYLRSDNKSSNDGTSGNPPGSSFKQEAAISGNSKQSSFDTSKYITPSDIESLEKKKTQNDKNSWDNYLEHVKYVSNESMHAELTASDQSDGKQLENIPLHDIAEVIGLEKELNKQHSRPEHCLPHPQFENRQKAVKRRPIDHSDETVHQIEQRSETGGQNAVMGEKSVAFGGHHLVLCDQNVIVTEQNTVFGRQNGAVPKGSCTVGGQKATVCEQNTATCGQNVSLGEMNMTNLMQNNKIPQMVASVPGMAQIRQNVSAEYLETPNFGDQNFIVFSEQGRIYQTVVGPPTTQPDFLLKNSLTQYAKFPISSTTVAGPTQTNPTYASQSFQAITPQTLHSGKMQSDSQLLNFTDSFETEMRSTPSSVEILKESRSSFNNDFFTVPDVNRNEISSGSSMKHVMLSAATNVYPAVVLQPHSSSLSSSAHSATTSASYVSRTQFKKPQNPSCSSGSSVTTYRGTTYPSVGGDSDVSMSSDTSLPNCMTLHEGGMDPEIQTPQQQTSATQNCEQFSLQFQQTDPHQLGQSMLQSNQQQAGQNMLQNTQQVGQIILQSRQQVGQNMLHSTQQQVGKIMLQSSQQQVGQNMLQNTQQQIKQNILQSAQVGPKMCQNKQQIQNPKLFNQQCRDPQMQQNQHQLLLQQQKHLQMEQAKKQQQMQNQYLLMQSQQQTSSQDYNQLHKQQMLNQQTLHFATTQRMDSQQQQQDMQNDLLYCEESQQKQLQHLHSQQQFEELLLQQQQSNQREQFYRMPIQKQQQIQKQGHHLQQQMINQQHQQIQSHQQHLHLQNPQHLHLQNPQQVQIQQLQKQPGEKSQNHQLQNQQQMQQYQQLLNQQHYQQMEAQQQQQIKKQQQKQAENQHLQQRQKQAENQLLQQQQKQAENQLLQQQQRPSQNSPTFTNIFIPQRTPGSRAGSTCSEPQPSRILPGTKFETRSMSQICDSVYSRQLANSSPKCEGTRDVQTFNAISDMALVSQSFQQLTGNSNQQVHGEDFVDNMHTNSMSGQNIETSLQNFNQHVSENQTSCNTSSSGQQPLSGSIDMAEQDQVVKSATETQLQMYLKEGFPSLNSAEYCQDTVAGSSFSPSNIPSLAQDKQQQNVAKTGQCMDSGDGSSEKSSRVQPAERSREEADSDLSVFSLGSGDDLLSFQQDNDGETPLHLLSELPKEGISSLPSMPGFYEALNLQNKNQETALDIAVKNENLDAVKFLVSHGADVNIFCLSSRKGTGSKAVHRNETVQQTALHEAVELGNKEIVKVLLTSQNVRVDARRPDSGLTPLMLALVLHRQSDRREIISELINHQASLHLHDTIQGKTPLMLAIQSRDVSLVEGILQQVGAEEARSLVSVRAKKDMTCLHFAAELRLESSLKKRLLRCIIVAGGDPSAKNSEGETPRDWAKTDINEVLQNLARLFSP